DLLVLGEMGIGNTTAAAAVTAILLDRPAEAATGRGTGVDDQGLARKLAAVEAPRRRVRGLEPGPPEHRGFGGLEPGPPEHRGSVPPMEVLRQAGGAELAAPAGAAPEGPLRGP